MKININKYKNFLTSFFNLLVVIFFSIITKKTTTANIYELFEHVYNFVGGQYLMTSLINRPINNIKEEYNTLIKKEIDFLQHVINGDIIVPEILKSKCDKYIPIYKEKWNPTYMENVNKFCQAVYELYQLSQITPIKNNELTNIIKNVNNVLENYPNKEILINTVIKPFVYNKYNNNKVNIIPLYLVGEPGTGKTKFVNDISKTLGSSVYHFSYQSADPYNNRLFEHFQSFDIKNVDNYMIEAMFVTKNRNIIFFVDEFDKKLLNQTDLCEKMLRILNFQGTLCSKYLHNIEFNIPNILFIFAGNKKISEITPTKEEFLKSFREITKPLENRMVYIEFPNMTKEIKKSIIYKHIKDNVTDTQIIIDYNYVDSMIEKDTNGGVRELILKTNIYINKIINKKFFEGTEWDREIEETEFEEIK